MATDFTATISPESDRYQEWLEVMGCNTVPLKHPFPVPANAPGIESGLFYEIDLGQLTPEQRERMVKHLAGKFGIAEEEVASTLDEVGCPILDRDVTVTVHNPQKWL